MGTDSVWDTIASQVAERIGDELFEAHRGVTSSRHCDVMAAFGNDGYAEDAKAKREVEAARQCIVAGGGTVLGFGTSSDGYSWVLLYRADNLTATKVTDAMWNGWQGAPSSEDPPDEFKLLFRAYQSAIADNYILDDLLATLRHQVINPN